MWPFNLSVRLPIVALVGRYPANWLIGRESISQRIAPLISQPCGRKMSCGISVLFKTLSPSERQVTHVLLTRPPLSKSASIRKLPPIYSVRLACVRHAASVRPEPGSNSLKYCIESPSRAFQAYLRAFVALFVHLRVAFLKSFACFPSRISRPILKVITGTSCKFLRICHRSLFNFQGSVRFPHRGACFTFYHAFACLSSTFFILFSGSSRHCITCAILCQDFFPSLSTA